MQSRYQGTRQVAGTNNPSLQQLLLWDPLGSRVPFLVKLRLSDDSGGRM